MVQMLWLNGIDTPASSKEKDWEIQVDAFTSVIPPFHPRRLVCVNSMILENDNASGVWLNGIDLPATSKDKEIYIHVGYLLNLTIVYTPPLHFPRPIPPIATKGMAGV